MKKILLPLLLLIYIYSSALSQDNSVYNGKTIRQINIKTSRISTEIVRDKFLMQEGEVFFEDNYCTAKQALHDMRVFKSIDFNITENDNETISINIDAKDGYYIFPMIFGTGGSKSTFASAIIEANLFKVGEMVFIFGAFNSDGFMTMAGVGMNNNFFNFGFSEMKFTESVYDNGSYSTSGLFTADANTDVLGKPVNKYDVKDNSFRLSWSRSFFERAGITIGFNTSDINYSGSNTPDDEGNHNKVILGIRSFKNLRPGGSGAGFGALLGVGLSDKEDKLADLPKKKLGYFTGLTYENGGSFIGSDFNISKINLKLVGNIEFIKRNILFIDFSAAKDFETSFHDKIKSQDVLSGKGMYSSEFRGDEAFGAGISFVWYPVKSRVGVLSVIPFIENATLWNSGSPQNQGGAGVIVSYQLWRFPFPIGLNYTQNLNDGSANVSFLFGGGF